jgi:lysophospholipase L1-like esterase
LELSSYFSYVLLSQIYSPLFTMTIRSLAITAFLILLVAPVSHASPLVRTPESAVTPSEKSRHNDFMRQIKAAHGDFDFVLIGDSITDGWPKKGADSYARFAPWKPLDLGVSGETTEEVLWRLLNGELDGIHPKVVMLMIGTNNLGRYGDEKPEWVVAGIKKILETIRAKQPQAKILLLAVFPRAATPQDAIRVRVQEVNKLLHPLADGKNIVFMDIGPKFLDPQGNLSKEIMPDLLHPNDQGYRIWIEAVRPKLEELLGSQLAPSAPVVITGTPTNSSPTITVKLTPLGSSSNK